ncbi:unnamed protein product [Ilex paraguariensis]|uniref:Uncharacterized protein n=1 Tax=Ilex paraguariensis TaxID=185542 RepID=A0ABC8QYN0_9AQUA
MQFSYTNCLKSFQDSTTPPVAATIFFGANDAALAGRTSERQHVPIEEYKENLKRLVRHLKISSPLPSPLYAIVTISSIAHNLYRYLWTPPQTSLHDHIHEGDDFECSPTMLVVLITPPPVYEEGRKEYARSLYGENAMELPERTNEVTGEYAKQCVELAKELGLPSINLWSKMQETEGWQTKFLRSLYGENAMELPERTNEVTGEYAKQCVELAKELGLPSINLWSKMQETEGWQTKFLSDGLHLTAEGNAVVHQEVVRVFSEAWLSAPEMPYDFPHHSEIDWKNPGKSFQPQCF